MTSLMMYLAVVMAITAMYSAILRKGQWNRLGWLFLGIACLCWSTEMDNSNQVSALAVASQLSAACAFVFFLLRDYTHEHE